MTNPPRQRHFVFLVLSCTTLVVWTSIQELRELRRETRAKSWSDSSLDSGSDYGSRAPYWYLRSKNRQSHQQQDLAAENATTIQADHIEIATTGTIANNNQSTINEASNPVSSSLPERAKRKETNETTGMVTMADTNNLTENAGADTGDNEHMNGTSELTNRSTDSGEYLQDSMNSSMEHHTSTREQINETWPIGEGDESTDANNRGNWRNSTADPNIPHSDAFNSSLWSIPVQPDVAAAQRIRNTVREYIEPLQNCNPTAQVRLILPQNASEESRWILQSVDEFGRDKTVGGDEYYITYKQQADQANYDLAAIQTDNNDGTYTLEFVTVPLNPHPPAMTSGGVLKVYFQFTCNIGRVPFPLKTKWTSGGSTLVVHEMSAVPLAPPYREFVPPNRDGSINLASYHLVVAFGDSLMRQFVKPRGVPQMNNTCYGENVYSTLETSKLPHFLEHLEAHHGKELRGSNATHKVALLLGSSVWDVSRNSAAQGTSFDDHIEACRQLVTTAQKLYPNANIYWKSASALHPHRIGQGCYESHTCNVSYQSSSRIGHLYVRQKALMKELGVPHLDVHEALYLSADQTSPGDIRHYEDDICLLVESFFYPGFDYLSWRASS